MSRHELPRMLMVVPGFPVPVTMGIQARQKAICEALARRFQLSVLFLLDDPLGPEALEWLARLGIRAITPLRPNRRSGLHRGWYRLGYEAASLLTGQSSDVFYHRLRPVRRALGQALESEPFEVVLGEFWFTLPELLTSGPWLSVLSTNDVLFEKALHLSPGENRPPRGWERYRRAERQAWRIFDLLVAISDHDAAVHREVLEDPGRVLVLTGGCDTARFRPAPEKARADTIVFYGAMSGQENIQAVLRFHREDWPMIRRERPGARLLVVGSRPPSEIRRLASEDVEVTGYLPDPSTRLQEASLVICPFSGAYGARMRLFELMALGLPVVTYPEAIRGMELGEEDGVLSASRVDFARAVIDLLADRPRRLELASRARLAAERRFSLDATYGRFADLLRQAADRHRSGVAPTWRIDP